MALCYTKFNPGFFFEVFFLYLRNTCPPWQVIHADAVWLFDEVLDLLIGCDRDPRSTQAE
jgi:hypothetical protein